MPDEVNDIASLVEFHREEERKEQKNRRKRAKAEVESKAVEVARDVAALERTRSGQFAPGVSGSPGGGQLQRESRSKSLVKVLAEETDGGRELLTRLLRFARGQIPGMTPKEEFDATRYLYERLAGKTPDLIAVADVSSHPALESLTADELRRLARGGDDE